MSELKLTRTLVEKLRDRRRAGLSNRELSAWLLATEGVTASHEAIRQALSKPEPGAPPPRAAAGARTTRPTPPDGPGPPPPLPSPSRAPAEPATGGPPGGSDLGDAEVYDRVIAETEEDIQRIRDDGGSPQALAVLRRLHADLLERRRKLRPPAVEPEVDAEMMQAGERAVAKLEGLVEAERAGARRAG